MYDFQTENWIGNADFIEAPGAGSDYIDYNL